MLTKAQFPQLPLEELAVLDFAVGASVAHVVFVLLSFFVFRVVRKRLRFQGAEKSIVSPSSFLARERDLFLPGSAMASATVPLGTTIAQMRLTNRP